MTDEKQVLRGASLASQTTQSGIFLDNREPTSWLANEGFFTAYQYNTNLYIALYAFHYVHKENIEKKTVENKK